VYKMHFRRVERASVNNFCVGSTMYESVSKSFRTGRLERELQMVSSTPLGVVVSLFCESV
jgi:hypothetical protein